MGRRIVVAAELSEYAFSPELLLERMQALYDAMCVLDLAHDRMTQVKYPAADTAFLSERCMVYSDALSAVVRSAVCEGDQPLVLSFLQPDAIRTALSAPGDVSEMTFLSSQHRWKKITLVPLSFEDGQASQVLYLLHDCSFVRSQVEVLRRENTRLREVSERDPLTDLFNRNKLDAMIETEYRGLHSCGVLFFDVNSLKQVNDLQGHAAGDALLRQVADSIRSITSRHVQAYRYGGDEFIAVVGNHPISHMDMLVELCESRLSLLSRRSGIASSVTVGRSYAVAPFHVRELIRLADADMYEHKRAARLPPR